MARYLVTGGAGFIGSNIVQELLKNGEYVRVLENFSTGRIENLAPFLKNIELIEGDIRDYHIVLRATRQIDFVLHQAALPSVPRSVNDPITTSQVNIQGTLNILYAALESRVKRVVFASSSSVYGDSTLGAKEETLPPNPKSPYAISKLAGENYCKIFHQLYGLETVVLRYFNVFGPRQNPNSQYAAVIPKFLALMRKGQSPQIYGDGKQSRDFTYVYNNVLANLMACEAPNVAGKIFNIGCGATFSLLELVEALNDILGSDIKPTFLEERPGDIKFSLASIKRAKEELMFQPRVSFHQGLQQLVEYILTHEPH